eukprot:scaffold84002_cov42-Prasinocladus_malaysianus.AAC.2
MVPLTSWRWRTPAGPVACTLSPGVDVKQADSLTALTKPRALLSLPFYSLERAHPMVIAAFFVFAQCISPETARLESPRTTLAGTTHATNYAMLLTHGNKIA